MGQFRQVEGAGRLAGKRKKKRKEEQLEPWTAEWRVEGVPEDKRFKSPGQALSAQRRVQRMKPRNPKGRKQQGRRPGPETAERQHHSRGKKLEKFVESLGGEAAPLSEYELRVLFDGRKIGGTGSFGDWKQSDYEDREPVKAEIVFDTFHGRKVYDREKGELVPWVPTDPEDIEAENKRKAKKRRRDVFASFCEECGVQLPTSKQKESLCGSCSPTLSAKAFFESVKKGMKTGSTTPFV